MASQRDDLIPATTSESFSTTVWCSDDSTHKSDSDLYMIHASLNQFRVIAMFMCRPHILLVLPTLLVSQADKVSSTSHILPGQIKPYRRPARVSVIQPALRSRYVI